MGVILHSFPIHGDVPTWHKEHQGRRSLSSSGGARTPQGLREHSSREDPASSYSMGHNDRNCSRQPSDSASARVPCQSGLCPRTLPWVTASSGPRQSQFRPPRSYCHGTSLAKSLLVANTFDRHDSLHLQLQHVQHHQVTQTTSSRPTATLTHTPTPLVTYCHRFHHRPTQLPR